MFLKVTVLTTAKPKKTNTVGVALEQDKNTINVILTDEDGVPVDNGAILRISTDTNGKIHVAKIINRDHLSDVIVTSKDKYGRTEIHVFQWTN